MKFTFPKSLNTLRLILATILSAVLLASVLFIAVDEVFARLEKNSLRRRCIEILSERSMMMGSPADPVQVAVQCRQVVP